MTKDEWYRQLFERLDNSRFRSSFHLKQKDIDYINEKGLDTIRQHAKDFITKREAPAYIANDGKQTPMRGHPVFIAQHATATCETPNHHLKRTATCQHVSGIPIRKGVVS